MKSFEQIKEEHEQLHEGKFRSGSIGTLAAKSVASGKKATKAYRRGADVLKAPTDPNDHMTKLDAIHEALLSLLEGHEHQNRQLQNHVALDAVGHLSRQRGQS